MYSRLSNALVAGASRVSTAYISVAPVAAPPGSTVAAPHVMECGTLTTASWPPSAAPIIVTATSVVMQQQQQQQEQSQQPPRRTRCLSSIAYASALDVTSAHPRHPLPMAVSRSPMWYSTTTRSQRGYALGRSTMSFTTKTFAEPSTVAAAADGGNATEEATSTTNATADSQSSSAGTSSSSSRSPSTAAASSAANAVVSGTVTLPDAMVFSFKGNPHEFQDRLRGANVLVFFYKAMCGPCAAIRSKLIHAVTDRLSAEAASLLNGTSHQKASEQPLEGAALGAGPAGANASGAATGAASGAASSTSGAHDGGVFGASSEAEAAMAVEDKAACAFACRTLEDVAKAFPHRMIFLTVDTNDNAKLTALHDIRSLPTFIAYRDGCMVGRVEGADEGEVRRLVQSITSEQSEAAAGGARASTAEASTPTP